MKISIDTSTATEAKAIADGLNAYNLYQVKALAQHWTPLDFTAKVGGEILVGGILAGIGYWLGLEIKALWIHESYRGQGIGSELLLRVENQAIAHHARISMVDTFDFQAESFYKKHGYQEVGCIHDFPEGHRRIYFHKKLSETGKASIS